MKIKKEIQHLEKISGNSEDLHRALAIYTNSFIDTKDVEGLRALIPFYEKLLSTSNIPYASIAYYNFSNLYDGLYQIEQYESDPWAWILPNKEKNIYFLRKAIIRSKKDSGSSPEMLTNLANSFSSLGRNIEAIELWQNAIEISPSFSMAIVNLAQGLTISAKTFYDEGHAWVYRYISYELLKTIDFEHLSLEMPYHFKFFHNLKDYLAQFFTTEKSRQNRILLEEEHSLGDTEFEKSYKKWCLENRLFINPLNSILKNTIAARDVLHLPSHLVTLKKGPYLISAMNHLKQEFCTARFLIFSAIKKSSGQTYADKDTFIMETHDNQIFSYEFEQLKIAYRVLYSLFDKIAFVLNEYFGLEIPESKVSFRKIWYKHNFKGHLPKKREINQELIDKENWNLRGLFWLSKDLYGNEFTREVLEPQAKRLGDIRNALEHKHLKVVSEIPKDLLNIDYGEYVTSKDLLDKTIHLAKLVRASIMYFSSMVYAEDQKTSREKVPSMQGYERPDSMKKHYPI